MDPEYLNGNTYTSRSFPKSYLFIYLLFYKVRQSHWDLVCIFLISIKTLNKH